MKAVNQPRSTHLPYTTLFRSAPASRMKSDPGGVPRRAFGRHSTEMVSALGLGGYHIGKIDSDREAVKLVHAAIEAGVTFLRSEEHTSELQSQSNLVCRPLLEK